MKCHVRYFTSLGIVHIFAFCIYLLGTLPCYRAVAELKSAGLFMVNFLTQMQSFLSGGGGVCLFGRLIFYLCLNNNGFIAK